MKKIILYLSVIFCIALIMIRGDSVIYYVKNSMQMCYEIIIPTLFPFFVCSGILIYSGFGSVLAKYAQGVMRPLFNVAPSGAAAFIIGIISGFPLGAITTVQLYKCGSLSKSEAERLLSFCNNSGPLFIIGSVGTAIYSKLSYGIILYLIHIISSIITGMIFRNYGKNHHTSPNMRLQTNEMSIADIFSISLSNASKNIITVCFSIIFFSSVSRVILSSTSLPPVLDAAASGFCEFSTGILKISMLDIDIYKKLILSSLIIGFSGISVHIQVMAVTSGSELSLKPYILGKIAHGIIAAALTFVTVTAFPVTVSVFSGCTSPLSASFAASAAITVFTVIAIIMFIFISLNILMSKRGCYKTQ